MYNKLKTKVAHSIGKSHLKSNGKVTYRKGIFAKL